MKSNPLKFASLLTLILCCACSSPAPAPESSPPPAPVTFQRWNSSDALDAFRRAGLEVSNARPMREAKDYGLAPMTATEGQRFLIPSLGEDNGGRVFSYSKPEDLEKMRRYYESLGRESAAFFSWVFIRENILVQINGQLPEVKARQYEAALHEMK